MMLTKIKELSEVSKGLFVKVFEYVRLVFFVDNKF